MELTSMGFIGQNILTFNLVQPANGGAHYFAHTQAAVNVDPMGGLYIESHPLRFNHVAVVQFPTKHTGFPI